MRTRLPFQEYLSGRPLLIDPSAVDLTSIGGLDPQEEASGFVGVKFVLTAAPQTPIRVRGRREDFYAVLLAAIAGGVDTDSYIPALVAAGGGTLAVQANTFRATRIGNQVRIVGAMLFTPAVNLTPELLTMSLPVTMQPAAAFGSDKDAVGVATIQKVHAVTEGVTRVASTGAGFTVELNATVTGATVIAVDFSYQIS